MPSFNVDDIVTDVDFVDLSLKCMRYTQVVNEKGRAVNTPKTTAFGGTVTSAKGQALSRFDAGAKQMQTILIVTKFRLSDGRTNQAADVVLWAGNQYTVTNVEQYPNYGQGFVQAYCELLPVTPV